MYSRKAGGKILTFGVSGLLYRSNVLMYDHQTESLWSQILGRAVTGPMTDRPLKVLPSTLTTWKKWKRRFPQTDVLSTHTGFDRDYSRDPYEEYYKSKKGLFSFFRPDPDEEEKELVAGIVADGSARAYPLDILREKQQLSDMLAGRTITITYDGKTDVLLFRDVEEEKVIPHMIAYWFVWKGIHKDTSRYGVK